MGKDDRIEGFIGKGQVPYIDSLYKALIAALLRFRAEILGNSREPLLSVWFGD